MILEFDYEKKTVTIKQKLKLSQLNEAMEGKEDWDIIQEPKDEHIYQPYNPYPVTWTTYNNTDSVTLTQHHN